MLTKVINLCKEYSAGNTNVPQIYSRLKMRIFNTQRELEDDFDWSEYHNHYLHEIKLLEKQFTLKPTLDKFKFEDGKVIKTDESALSLHPNHELLYQTILALNPASALEVGCGGGDHLNALFTFSPSTKFTGIDRSQNQLDFLKSRHPNLVADLSVLDASGKDTEFQSFDLVYTQAVLMHISETNFRFHNALENVFRYSNKYVVLMENWTQHDFEGEVASLIKDNKFGWGGGVISFVELPSDGTRIMIVTKN